MKRIVFVLNELLEFDAISNYVCLLAEQLNMSYSLELLTFYCPDSIKGRLQLPNVSITFYNSGQGRSLKHELQTMVFPFKLARNLAQSDLLIIVGERPPFIPVFLAKFMKSSLPLVWDFHGITPPSFHKSTRRYVIESIRLSIVKFLMKYSNYRIVHSKFMQQEVERLFGDDSAVYSLGVDTARFHPKKKRRGSF